MIKTTEKINKIKAALIESKQKNTNISKNRLISYCMENWNCSERNVKEIIKAVISQGLAEDVVIDDEHVLRWLGSVPILVEDDIGSLAD